MLPNAAEILSCFVRERSGIVIDASKRYLLESRLLPLAKSVGVAGLEGIATAITAAPHGALARQVLDAMTTNETYFFRDEAPFVALQRHVIPALIRTRSALRRITIWCAACSSGQEPYSLAIVLREHFPELVAWSVKIIATDLSEAMLERTRSGCYSTAEIDRGLAPLLRDRHFAKVSGSVLEWQASEALRRLIEVRPLNLVGAWTGLPTCDLILLRNVLIYFDVAAKKTILGKARGLLAPDGHLLLGGAESTLNLDDHFVREPWERAGCYRLLRSDEVRDSQRSDRIAAIVPNR